MTRLDQLLSSLGYCSRREVKWLLREKRVSVNGSTILSATIKVNREDVLVDGEDLDPGVGFVLALNKPTGYECSLKPKSGPSVFSLLPERFLLRRPSVSAVGRLDIDSSGLLLFTDDGPLVHKLISPKFHVDKEYCVVLRDNFRGDEKELFASGDFQLPGEKKVLKPVDFFAESPNSARLILREGKHRQIRRMFEELGNEVLELHRIRTGNFTIGTLGSGESYFLTKDEISSLY